MAVVTPEEKWTDDRLDDFDKRVGGGLAQLEKKMDDGFENVDARFEKVDERFDKVEGKIESGIKELRGEMNERFQGLDARFDSLQRSLFVAAIVIVAALIGSNVL